MQPQLLRDRLKDLARRLHGKRRQRIGRRTGALERIGAREPGHAELLFHFRVVRFEIGVTDGPILERCSGQTAPSRPLLEIHLMEAPEIRCEVNGAATDLLTV